MHVQAWDHRLYAFHMRVYVTTKINIIGRDEHIMVLKIPIILFSPNSQVKPFIRYFCSILTSTYNMYVKYQNTPIEHSH